MKYFNRWSIEPESRLVAESWRRHNLGATRVAITKRKSPTKCCAQDVNRHQGFPRKLQQQYKGVSDLSKLYSQTKPTSNSLPGKIWKGLVPGGLKELPCLGLEDLWNRAFRRAGGKRPGSSWFCRSLLFSLVVKLFCLHFLIGERGWTTPTAGFYAVGAKALLKHLGQITNASVQSCTVRTHITPDPSLSSAAWQSISSRLCKCLRTESLGPKQLLI